MQLFLITLEDGNMRKVIIVKKWTFKNNIHKRQPRTKKQSKKMNKIVNVVEEEKKSVFYENTMHVFRD